jgi:hypothetical protein
METRREESPRFKSNPINLYINIKFSPISHYPLQSDQLSHSLTNLPLSASIGSGLKKPPKTAFFGWISAKIVPSDRNSSNASKPIFGAELRSFLDLRLRRRAWRFWGEKGFCEVFFFLLKRNSFQSSVSGGPHAKIN